MCPTRTHFEDTAIAVKTTRSEAIQATVGTVAKLSRYVQFSTSRARGKSEFFAKAKFGLAREAVKLHVVKPKIFLKSEGSISPYGT